MVCCGLSLLLRFHGLGVLRFEEMCIQVSLLESMAKLGFESMSLRLMHNVPFCFWEVFAFSLLLAFAVSIYFSLPFLGAVAVLTPSPSSLHVRPLPLSSLIDPPPLRWPCLPMPSHPPFGPLLTTTQACSPPHLDSHPRPRCFKLPGTQLQAPPYLVRET